MASNISQAVQNRDRPFGVTIIAAWIGTLGGIYLILLLLSLFALQLLSQLLQPPIPISPSIPGYPSTSTLLPSLDLASYVNVGAILLFLLYITAIAATHLAIARGLFLLQQWAYWTAVGVEAGIIVIAFVSFANTSNSLSFITNTFLPALTIIYLLVIPGVRKAFKVPF